MEGSSGPFEGHFGTLRSRFFGGISEHFFVFLKFKRIGEHVLSRNAETSGNQAPRSSLWASLGLLLAHFGVAGGGDLERTYLRFWVFLMFKLIGGESYGTQWKSVETSGTQGRNPSGRNGTQGVSEPVFMYTSTEGIRGKIYN